MYTYRRNSGENVVAAALSFVVPFGLFWAMVAALSLGGQQALSPGSALTVVSLTRTEDPADPEKTVEQKAAPRKVAPAAPPARNRPKPMARSVQPAAIAQPSLLEIPLVQNATPGASAPGEAATASAAGASGPTADAVSQAAPLAGGKESARAPARQGGASADSYGALVFRRVKSRQAYTPELGARRLAGTVVVEIRVGSRGEITAVTIFTSSGRAEIDRLALSQVRSAGPLPPPPNAQQRHFLIPMTYRPA